VAVRFDEARRIAANVAKQPGFCGSRERESWTTLELLGKF